MTDYVAQASSKMNGKLYYVSVTAKNREKALEKLSKDTGFNFFVYTKAEFWRHIYETKYVYEAFNEDGSVNEYHYISWEKLPTSVKASYRLRAMNEVIVPHQLKW